MALKGIIDSIDGLPADVAKEYVKKDDGFFHLDVQPAEIKGETWAFENVTGLKRALQSEKGTRQQLEQKLEQLKDIDPAAAREALTKVKEMANWTPEEKVRAQVEAVTKQLEQKHTTALQGVASERDTALKHLERLSIEEAATRALAAKEGNVTLLLPHVKNRCRMRRDGANIIVEVLDDSGNVRISPKGSSTAAMTIEELVDEMKNTDVFGPAFKGSNAAGSGTRGGTPAGGSTGQGTTSSGAKRATAAEVAAGKVSLEDVATGKVVVTG